MDLTLDLDFCLTIFTYSELTSNKTFRLLNILAGLSIKRKIIWDSVKKKRKYFVLEKFSSSQKSCGYEIIDSEAVGYILQQVEKQLNLPYSIDIQQNVPHEIIENAGEMFVYIIACPCRK